MSEKMNQAPHDLSIYDGMTTQELAQILRQDADSQECGETDTEALLYIMELLANRESADAPGKTPEQAWDAFQRYYLAGEEITMESPVKKKAQRKHKKLFHRIAAAAAVLVLAVAIPLTVSAIVRKQNWNVIPFWSGGSLHLLNSDPSGLPESIPDDGTPRAAMQAFLLDHDVDPRIVPTWLPEGFVKYNFKKTDVDWEEYFFSFRRGEQTLMISVIEYQPENPSTLMGGDAWNEVYHYNGMEYHVFPNYDQVEATWIDGKYQCVVGGDVTVEEIKQMIHSIKRG